MDTLVFLLLAAAFCTAAVAVIAPRCDLRLPGVLLGAAFVLAFTAPARAAGGTSFDLAPVIDLAAPYLIEAVVALVAVVVLPVLRKWLGLRVEAEHRAALDQALRQGAAWGIAKAREHAKGRADIVVRNAALASAMRYVMDATPDAIRTFGLTPERVKELIEARMAPSPFEVELLDSAETIERA